MELDIPFLIIGLTGPINAGCSTLAKAIVSNNPREFIKEENMYCDVIERIKALSNKLTNLNGSKTELYQKLIERLKERAYLHELQKIQTTRFINLSMSELIIKLAIMNVGSDSWLVWKQKNEEIAGILENANHKFMETISFYDSSITNKKYHDLEGHYAEIDKLLDELRQIRSDIGRIEKTSLFDHKFESGLILQEFGDALRKTGDPFSLKTARAAYNNDLTNDKTSCLYIVANEANNLIKYYRNRVDSSQAHCFVIDAFRNHLEVEFFRKRYEQFILVSILADQSSRENRFLKDLEKTFGKEPDEYSGKFEKIDKRDSGKLDVAVGNLFSQNVSRCCYLSDISIFNNRDDADPESTLYRKFLKYLALIVSPGCVQPSEEETYMNMAYSLSLRSSCISRQVGAVITDSEGYILGQGWNDVGHEQIGCSLRTKEDYLNEEVFHAGLISQYFTEEDLTGHDSSDAICFKDVLSKIQIKKKLIDEDPLIDFGDIEIPVNIAEAIEKNTKDKVVELLKIKRLEYCRSLHAEENALLQVASKGVNGVKGGTIYTTTFPCELCAKKIYQSGIIKIIYTEPYPDGISEMYLSDGLDSIDIRPFEGVKSSGYFKLYKPRYDKKEAQKMD